MQLVQGEAGQEEEVEEGFRVLVSGSSRRREMR